MKKSIAAVVLVCFSLLVGCKSDISNRIPQGAGFNQETFVWECLHSPTNRVMDRK